MKLPDIIIDDSDTFEVDTINPDYVRATVTWPTREFVERITILIENVAITQMAALLEEQDNGNN